MLASLGVPSPRGARVLDAPSGPGLLSEALRRLGFAVVAGDLDAGAFAARGRTPFAQLDLDAPLPFADAVFDAAVCSDGIEHLENPFALFRELARVLAPDGLLVVATPNYLHVRRRLRFLLTGSLERPLTRPSASGPEPKRERGHISPLTLTRMARAAEEAGLALDGVRTVRGRRAPLWLAPLALAARANAARLSREHRHALFAEHTLGWPLLMGGETLVARFRRMRLSDGRAAV